MATDAETTSSHDGHFRATTVPHRGSIATPATLFVGRLWQRAGWADAAQSPLLRRLQADA